MSPRSRQRGSIALTLGLLLIGLVSMLGLVEVGYLYWAHRNVQKIADLAALSGAQRLDTCSAPNGSNTAAIDNAKKDNHFTGNVVATCGYWSPTVPGKEYFGSADGDHPANAVRSTATLPLSPFFGFADFNGVSATAIAANRSPVATFSVGSQLLELQNAGIVPGLLKLVGLDVGGTSLAGYEGLANLHVTPAGLLRALGIDVSSATDIGTLNQILAAHSVSISQLLDAMIDLGEQQHLAQASLQALHDLLTAQADAPGPLHLIQLGTDTGSTNRGLFSRIRAATAKAALDAQVSALDLINVALQAANSRHFVEIPGLSLPGVAAKVSVIEPPSIAVGGPGTTAYTAQVRLGVKLDTDALPALGGLLKALGITIHLPLVLDVVSGQATLTGLCDPDAKTPDGRPAPYPSATFDTLTHVLEMCVGDFDWNNLPSTQHSCGYGLTGTTLVWLLGAPVVWGNMDLPAFSHTQSLTMQEGQTKRTQGISLTIGDVVSNLTSGILNMLANHPDTPTSSELDNMTDKLWTQAGCSDSSGTSARNTCMKKIDEWMTQPVSQETAGLVPGLLDLVGGLIGSVGNILGDVLGGIANPCTGVLGTGLGGSVDGCKNMVHSLLSHSQPAQNSIGSILNAVLAPVAQLLDVLRPALNLVGDQVLKPLLKSLLGDTPGHTDVHLMSLQCHGAQLVY